MPPVSRQGTRRDAQKRARLASADAARPRCTLCSSVGEDAKPLIIACCCSRLVHPGCFKDKQLESIRQAMRDGVVFPLSNIWDCPDCGSGYRFRCASGFVRSFIDRPWVFPALFVVMCFWVFVIVCEMTCLGMCQDRMERSYLTRGCTILAMIPALTLDVKQVLLMYICIVWLCDGSDSMSWSTMLCFVGIVGYNVFKLTKRIYMYSLLLFVRSTTPSAYLLCGMDTPPLSAHDLSGDVGPAEAGDHISGADTAQAAEPQRAGLLAAERTQCCATMPDALGLDYKATDSMRQRQKVSGPSSESRCECICCLELPASCVASGCGHLVACANCRRRLVYKELRERAVFGLPRMRDLRGEMLLETTVRCPMCRAEGKLVDQHVYGGVVFTP